MYRGSTEQACLSVDISDPCFELLNQCSEDGTGWHRDASLLWVRFRAFDIASARIILLLANPPPAGKPRGAASRILAPPGVPLLCAPHPP